MSNIEAFQHWSSFRSRLSQKRLKDLATKSNCPRASRSFAIARSTSTSVPFAHPLLESAMARLVWWKLLTRHPPIGLRS